MSAAARQVPDSSTQTQVIPEQSPHELLIREQWCRWWLVGSVCALVFVTRGLWFPLSDWPGIPWFAWGCAVPRSVDLVLLGLCAAGLGLLLRERSESWGARLFLAGWCGLLLLDQMRTQPWAVHFAWIALVWSTIPRGQRWRWIHASIVVIYLASALSKFDVTFQTGLGRTMTAVLLQNLNLPAVDWLRVWPRLPLLLPVGELMLALLLLIPRGRRWGLWGAWTMHGLMLLVLGPWGLNHQPGVLVWNLAWIVLDGLVYGLLPGSKSPNPAVIPAMIQTPNVGSPGRSSPRPGRWITLSIGLWLAVWPLLEPWGLCDHWLAWGLYAAHGEQMVIWLSPTAAERVPPERRRFLIADQHDSATNDAFGPPRYRWRIDTMSLLERHAPVYPQNRVQGGLALEFARRWGISGDEISVDWLSSAKRWTGTRTSEHFPDQTALQARLARCWFNHQAR